MLFHGGEDGGNHFKSKSFVTSILDDMWVYDLNSKEWSELRQSPKKGTGMGMGMGMAQLNPFHSKAAFDASSSIRLSQHSMVLLHDELIVFGGMKTHEPLLSLTDSQEKEPYNQVWKLNLTQPYRGWIHSSIDAPAKSSYVCVYVYDCVCMCVCVCVLISTNAIPVTIAISITNTGIPWQA